MDAGGASAFAGELLAQGFFQFFAVFEVNGNVDVARDIGLGEIELLDEGGEEFSGMEFLCGGGALPRVRMGDPGPHRRAEVGEVFPEKFAAVQNFSSAHVE